MLNPYQCVQHGPHLRRKQPQAWTGTSADGGHGNFSRQRASTPEPYSSHQRAGHRLQMTAGGESYQQHAHITMLTSPVDHAKRIRRLAAQVLFELAPVEDAQRQLIGDDEACCRASIFSRKFSDSHTLVAIEKLVQDEDAVRCVHLFNERSDRRLLTRRAPQLRESLSTASFATASNESFSTNSKPSTPERGKRRRGHKNDDGTEEALKRLVAALDSLDDVQSKQRDEMIAMESALRHQLSAHLFYDLHYEFQLHLFDNVPRVAEDEYQRRQRCMVMLHEFRARREICMSFLDTHYLYCAVLSPFSPPSITALRWVDVEKEMVDLHFEYLDGKWKLEELVDRSIIKQKFEEERRRTLRCVHAYIILEEPTTRLRLLADERKCRGALITTCHPRLSALKEQHMRWLMRRCLRKLVGYRAFRDATIRQRQHVQVLESRALEKIRGTHFEKWRKLVLGKKQHRVVGEIALQNRCLLLTRYLQQWGCVATRRISLRNKHSRLSRRTSVHMKNFFLQFFVMWKRFRLQRMAGRLLDKNTVVKIRAAATQWYWGAWKLKRQKLYRAKFYKMERTAQLWRIARTMRDWGKEGFLAVQHAKKMKHAEVAAMATENAVVLLRRRMTLWKLFVKRRKQSRLAIRLEMRNNNYHKLRRFATWLELISIRDGVRKINQLFICLTPHWMRPFFVKWRQFTRRRKEAIAEVLLKRNQERRIIEIVPQWRQWAWRHRYKAALIREGQTDLLRGKNRLRYELMRLRTWIVWYLRRLRERKADSLRVTSTERHRALAFMRWSIVKTRTSQVRTVKELERHRLQGLTRRYFHTLAAFRLDSQRKRDTTVVACSLERKNRKLFARRMIRIWNARSLCVGRLSPIVRSAAERVLRRYFDVLKRFILWRRDDHVAENLRSVNRDRWAVMMFREWRTAARLLHKERLAVVLSQTNAARRLAQVWRRSWQAFAKWLPKLRLLQHVQWKANVCVMRRYLNGWGHYAHTWKREMLAHTLMLTNTHRARAECFGKLRRYATTVAADKKCVLLRMTYYGADRRNSVAKPPASRRLASRYFVKWREFFARRINRIVATRTLAMLREHWYRRAYWSMWAASAAMIAAARELDSPQPKHVRANEPSNVPSSRRQTLRELRALEKVVAASGETSVLETDA